MSSSFNSYILSVVLICWELNTVVRDRPQLYSLGFSFEHKNNRNANKVKSHPSLQKGGCNEVHDIEDLVKVGRSVKG